MCGSYTELELAAVRAEARMGVISDILLPIWGRTTTKGPGLAFPFLAAHPSVTPELPFDRGIFRLRTSTESLRGTSL